MMTESEYRANLQRLSREVVAATSLEEHNAAHIACDLRIAAAGGPPPGGCARHDDEYHETCQGCRQRAQRMQEEFLRSQARP